MTSLRWNGGRLCVPGPIGLGEKQRLLSFPEVLVYPAALHDHCQIRVGFFEKRDVGDRIAIDDEQISQRVLFYDPLLSRVGIARSRQGEELPIDGGRHAENVHVVVPTPEMGQHALTSGLVARKEQIGAERCLYFVLLRERVERIRAGKHSERIESALAGQSAGPRLWSSAGIVVRIEW